MALPRFFKIFLSHFSSASMMIPASYYDELPLVLPKTALLQGSTGGCFWKVALVKRRDEVYFGQGWTKFVEDNRLRDGDMMTFVYDGSRNFKISIYGGSGGCKEVRAAAQVIAVDDDDDEDGKEGSVCSLSSSEGTIISSEPEMAQTVPNARNQEDANISDTSPESEVVNTVPRNKNKGKKRVVVVDSEDSNSLSDDSSYSPPNEDTLLEVTPKVTKYSKKKEPEMAQTVPNARNRGPKHTEDSNIIEPEMAKTAPLPRTRNKGKKRVVVVQDSEDSDSMMSGDSSYSPPDEDTLLDVTPKVTNSKKKGNSIVGSISNSSRSVSRKKPSTITNPEMYLDDPNNVCFETTVKNRIYELRIPKQLLKDYSLKFQEYVIYIDNHKDGTLEGTTATWQDRRVIIKKWDQICQRNGLKKGDRLLCELFRKEGLVYAVKIHFFKTTTT